MSTTVTSFDDQLWARMKLFSKRSMGLTLHIFRDTQLRDTSLYSGIRAYVPMIWLACFWWNRLRGLAVLGIGSVWTRTEPVNHLVAAASILIIWNLWLRLHPFERRAPAAELISEAGRLGLASLACGLSVLLWEIIAHRFFYGMMLSAAVAAGLFAISVTVLGAFLLSSKWAPLPGRRRAAIIVGTGRRAELLKASLQRGRSAVRLYGRVDDERLSDAGTDEPYLGTISNLADVLKSHPIEVVYVGLPMRSKYDEIQRVLAICETVGVEVHFLRNIFDTARARVQVHSGVPHEFSVVSAHNPHPAQNVKRVVDFLGALLLLLLLSPVMLIAALAIFLTSPGPIFFVQQRYGFHRERFPMFKFRSMVPDAEKHQAALEEQNEAQGPVFKLRRDPRITRVGAFLRKTSIDELPQLFNVLRGEMSLVGPRPLPLRDVSRFQEAWLLRRFSVRPGLTCTWQVNGRSDTSFDEWIRQDLEYIDRWSLLLDASILLRTIPAVLRGSGAA